LISPSLANARLPANPDVQRASAFVQNFRAWSTPKAQSDNAGLAWDPFLSTKDPAPQYEVGIGRISHEGHFYGAEIYSVQAGKRSEQPEVGAQFTEDAGHRFCVNFYYPGGSLEEEIC